MGTLHLRGDPPVQLPVEGDSRALALVARASQFGRGVTGWPWVFANRRAVSAQSLSSRVSHSPSPLELDLGVLAGARSATAGKDPTASTSFPPSPESRPEAQRERPGVQCSARHPGVSSHPLALAQSARGSVRRQTAVSTATKRLDHSHR